METVLSIENNQATSSQILKVNNKQVNFLPITSNFKELSIDKILSFNPSAILLDIELLCAGDTTGIGIAKMLRTSEKTKDIPIIMLSTRVEHKEYMLQNKLCDRFLPKPASIRIVFEQIEYLTGLRQKN